MVVARVRVLDRADGGGLAQSIEAEFAAPNTRRRCRYSLLKRDFSVAELDRKVTLKKREG